jgi:transposase
MRQCLRGHLFEYGYTFPQGIGQVTSLVALVEDPRSSLPEGVRSILKLLVDTFTALEAQIAALDSEISRRSKTDPTARRLMTIPGIGPIVSTAITALASTAIVRGRTWTAAPRRFPAATLRTWVSKAPDRGPAARRRLRPLCGERRG